MKNPVIITGASGSMGSAAVKALAANGIPVVMACRNLNKGEEIRRRVLSELPKEAGIELLRLDLGSLDGVDGFLDQIKGRKFSAIFNNAGIINRDFGLTPDGMERTMAVNFFNTAYLTLRIADQLDSNVSGTGTVSRPRVVNMVSLTTRFAHLDENWDKTTERDFSQLGTYGKTKLALLLFTAAFAKHHPELTVNVSDPGVVNSNMISMGRWFDPLADIFFRPFISSPEKGVAPALRALEAENSLDYYVGKGKKPIAAKYLENPLGESLYQKILMTVESRN